MPKFIQKKVIDLFNNSEIKTLLATSSVIEGVNTPTKNIYITTATQILGDKNIIKFKNLIGRAGRLGIHKVGNVFYKEIHKQQFEKANVPYEDIQLNFIINYQLEIIEINREEEYKAANNNEGLENKSEDLYKEKTKGYLEDSNYGKVPLEEISKLLNNYGFTIKQFKKLTEYITSQNINLFGILGKLKSSDKDIYSVNTILNSEYTSIRSMVEQLKLESKFSSLDNTKLVSITIKMIYSVIPHRVIPAIEFILELDKVYKIYNKKHLLSASVLKEANIKKALFYIKFIGETNVNIEESKKIIIKLFEYGIPYFRVKEHLARISERVPNNFSIYDIKKIIFDDDAMADLKIYFE